MAVLEVKVPQLSESVTEATLLQWHKKAGEKVALDENLVDIETDKVVLELPSPAAGVLASIVKKDGDIVVAGEVIATIDTAGAAETGKEAAATAAPAKRRRPPSPDRSGCAKRKPPRPPGSTASVTCPIRPIIRRASSCRLRPG